VGGLIGVSGGFESGEIVNSFSAAAVEEISYDATPLRAGGFIAVKYETVFIENCYSLYGIPPIASGDSDGITTLSSAQFLQAESLAGFDFDNYWTYNGGALRQRTIAVSSNEQVMSGTRVKIVGDRNYYLSQENAVLVFYSGEKPNIGIKSVIVDGTERKAQFIDGEYDLGAINEQVNVWIEGWYLIMVETSLPIEDGNVVMEKQFYAPNEEIVLVATPNRGFAVESISATFKTHMIDFAKCDTKNAYKASYLGTSEFASNDVLNINIIFNRVKSNSLVWLYIVIGVVVAVTVIIVSLVLMKKYRRIDDNAHI
jgi:hypothetical protein